MTFGPGETQGPFIPPNIILPDNYEEASLILTDYLIKMAEAINARDIAQYQDSSLDSSNSNISETVTGQTWFTPSDPNKFRYGSRTVINFGALPNNTTKQVRHGISVTTNTIFTYIGGCASIPGSRYIPIPHADIPSSHVEINVGRTNVNIRTNSNYSTYTQCYIVLEWIESV